MAQFQRDNSDYLVFDDSEVTMAQLCLDTTPIAERDVYEIHLFGDVSMNDPMNSATVGRKVPVAVFEQTFYGRREREGDTEWQSRNTDQKFGAYVSASRDASGIGGLANANLYNLRSNTLDDQDAALADGVGTYGWQQLMQSNSDTDQSGVNFVDEVLALWGNTARTDAVRFQGSTAEALQYQGRVGNECSDPPAAPWSTCSLMAIRKELIEAHDYRDLANCNVCCALNYGDLCSALQYAQQENGRDSATTKIALAAGDDIALEILIKNSHPGAKDVAVIVHFELTA